MDINLFISIIEIGMIAVGGKVLWSINETIKAQKEIIDSQKALIDGFKSQADILGNIVKSVESAQRFFDPRLLDSALELHTRKIELYFQKQSLRREIVEDTVFTIQDEINISIIQESPRPIVTPLSIETNKGHPSTIANDYLLNKIQKYLENNNEK